MQAHTHTYTDNGNLSGPSITTASGSNKWDNTVTKSTGSTGGGNAENLQPYQVTQFVIKL